MPVLSGKVANITTRDVNTKYGTKPAYTVHLEDGSKFDTDFKAPGSLGVPGVGNPVTVTVTESKYGMKFQGLGGTPDAAGNSPAAKQSGGGGGISGRPFPVPKNSGEMAIIRQNALTNAVNTVMGYVGTLPPDQATEYMENIEEQVISIAYKYAEFSSGQREVRLVEEMGE
jgi:hypothetical protein